MNGRTCWTIAGLAAGVALGQLTATACTGMYAGRKVTVDGTMMYARTIDLAPTEGVSRLERVARGTRYNNRYSYVCTPYVETLGHAFGAAAAVNERGLVLSGTVTAYVTAKMRELDPYVHTKISVGEKNLSAMVAGDCATAREAIAYCGRKIAECGYDSSDIYIFADTNETWMLEALTGHEWAALKVPDDKIAVFGNEFMIREYDLNDKENVIYSPGLLALAKKAGGIVWIDEQKGIMDLYETYSKDYRDGPHYRTYFGHRMLAPSTAGAYDPKKPYPLFFDPEPGTKIALTNFFAVMRTRYEGVNCPEENLDVKVRTIGTTSQHSSHVVQLRYDLPERYRGTIWYAPSKAQYSVYLPLNGSIESLVEEFSRDQTEGPYRYDPQIAGMEFERLYALARMREYVFTNATCKVDLRPYYGAGIRAYWEAKERAWTADWNDRLTRAAAADDAKGLTAYSVSLQRGALADARQMFDELVWYACHNVRISGDGGGATDVPKEPYVPFRRRQADWKAGVVVP